jgi:signal transduction histidine kinase
MKPYEQMTKEQLLLELRQKDQQARSEHEISARLLYLLNTGKDSHSLVGSLLSFFQELAGCEAVGVRLRDDGDCPYFETLGFPSGFVQAENHLCAKDQKGRPLTDENGEPVVECMCGTVLSGRLDPDQPYFTQNGSFWSNSTSELLAGMGGRLGQARMRNTCNTEGYESAALIPLRNNGTTIGLMQLNDRRKGLFSAELIALIERLADSMAIAVVRRQADDALRESEEHYRAIVMAFDGLMLICSPDYRIEFQNEAMKQHIGHDATGEFCYKALNGLDSICPWCANDLVFAGESVRWVKQSPRDNRWYDVSSTPIKNLNGTVSKQALIVDVTERKEMEDLLISQQNELKQANELLEKRVAERTAELQAAIRTQESFSYTVSHDLRAPLRHINSFSSILMEDHAEELSDEARDYLNRICLSSKKMGTLIDNLLDLSRVSKTKIKLKPVNLSQLADSALSMFQETEPERLVGHVVEQGLTVRGDESLLRQLLENLLGNAWKYTAVKKRASIEFGKTLVSGEEAYFVKDNGAGFDMTYKDKLFSAFERLHGSEFEGMGIGLATARRIIQRHEGTIWAEGRINEGATFYFTLPTSTTGKAVTP